MEISSIAHTKVFRITLKWGAGKFPVPHYNTHSWRRFDEETP
jgi:hypothetical protein